MTPADETWMRRALELAERGRGAVEPNPLVGGLAGEGWHRKYGAAHAEVNALAAAGEAARGGTLYVTLEPCCQVGKTPPCTDAVTGAEDCDLHDGSQPLSRKGGRSPGRARGAPGSLGNSMAAAEGIPV